MCKKLSFKEKKNFDEICQTYPWKNREIPAANPRHKL